MLDFLVWALDQRKKEIKENERKEKKKEIKKRRERDKEKIERDERVDFHELNIPLQARKEKKG